VHPLHAQGILKDRPVTGGWPIGPRCEDEGFLLEASGEAHAGQTRASGEPYISHCVAVAEILLEMNMPATVVAAGLLHDTLEDTDLTYEDLKETFGEEVANLVEGVTKLTALPRVSRADLAQRGENGREAPSTEEEKPPSPKASSWRRQDLIYENLRKTFLAMWEDIRVVPIKLAWTSLPPWPTGWAWSASGTSWKIWPFAM